MAGLFLSYRRSDAEGQAGRLYDDLAAHFGQDNVFMDVAGIEAGRDFRRAIDQHVTSCGVLLALIGKDWLSATDNNGRRRLDDPNDFVRLEVAAALKRDIPVVPVLVRGADMPQAADLPPDCADLAYRNAVELTHARWNSDVEVLIKALERHVGNRPAPAPQAATAPAADIGKPASAGSAPAQPARAKTWLIAMPIAMAIAGGGVMAWRANTADDTKGGERPVADQKSPPPLVVEGGDKPAPKPVRDSTGDPADGRAPTGGGASTLSEWMPTSQFQAYRQARPPGERFPYDVELDCVKKGENRIRARFGAQPAGVQEVRIGHWLFRGEPKLPPLEGFREFSVAQCTLPAGGRVVMRIAVRP